MRGHPSNTAGNSLPGRTSQPPLCPYELGPFQCPPAACPGLRTQISQGVQIQSEGEGGVGFGVTPSSRCFEVSEVCEVMVDVSMADQFIPSSETRQRSSMLQIHPGVFVGFISAGCSCQEPVRSPPLQESTHCRGSSSPGLSHSVKTKSPMLLLSSHVALDSMHLCFPMHMIRPCRYARGAHTVCTNSCKKRNHALGALRGTSRWRRLAQVARVGTSAAGNTPRANVGRLETFNSVWVRWPS